MPKLEPPAHSDDRPLDVAPTPDARRVDLSSPPQSNRPAEPLIVDFGNGAKATVFAREIHYKDRLWDDRIAFEIVTGICYGGVVTKLQGVIPISWAYKLALTDSKRCIIIEHPSPSLRREEADNPFRTLFEALWGPLTSRLVETIVQAARGGPQVTLSHALSSSYFGVAIDSSGLTWRPTRAFGLPLGVERTLPWKDFAGHTVESGMIHLFRKRGGKPKVWASLSLRDSWNAVCLGPALTHLYKSGDLGAR